MRLLFLLPVALAGCDMGHLGNPVLLPVSALITAVGNAGYDARRQKLSDHVSAHHPDILRDIRAGTGPALTTALDLAGIAPATRPDLLALLKKDFSLFQADTPKSRENLVVTLMVHGV